VFCEKQDSPIIEKDLTAQERLEELRSQGYDAFLLSKDSKESNAKVERKYSVICYE